MASVEVARGLLFTRAIARVCSSHEDLRASAATRIDFARMMGEFVALLAIIYLAENAVSKHPWTPLLGVVFAFLLPTIVLRDRVISDACAALNMKASVRNHILVGVVGVFLCFAIYEATLRLVELAYDAYY